MPKAVKLVLPERPCRSCGVSFRPRRVKQSNCRTACRVDSNNVRLRLRLRKGFAFDRLIAAANCAGVERVAAALGDFVVNARLTNMGRALDLLEERLREVIRAALLLALLASPLLAEDPDPAPEGPPKEAPPAKEPEAPPAPAPSEKPAVEEPKRPVDPFFGERVHPFQFLLNFGAGAAATGYLHESIHRHYISDRWERTDWNPAPFSGHTGWELKNQADEPKDSDVARFSFSAMIGTRLASEALTLGLKSRYVPPPAESLFASTALVMRMDGYWQLLKGQTNADDSDWRIGAKAAGFSPRWGLALLAGDLALDYYFRGDIALLWDVARGKRSLWDERRDGRPWSVSVGLRGDAVMASLEIRF